MATIFVQPTEGGRFGPLDGPFTILCDPEAASVVASVIVFARTVSRGISFYNNKGGFADSSLFKSFANECFAELESDDPPSAALLTNLVVDCRDLDAAIHQDKIWQLHRAILATLPGVQFLG